MTERTWKRICYTVLAVLVPLLTGLVLANWMGLNTTVTSVLVYGTMAIWLVLIWRPPHRVH